MDTNGCSAPITTPPGVTPPVLPPKDENTNKDKQHKPLATSVPANKQIPAQEPYRELSSSFPVATAGLDETDEDYYTLMDCGAKESRKTTTLPATISHKKTDLSNTRGTGFYSPGLTRKRQQTSLSGWSPGAPHREVKVTVSNSTPVVGFTQPDHSSAVQDSDYADAFLTKDHIAEFILGQSLCGPSAPGTALSCYPLASPLQYTNISQAPLAHLLVPMGRVPGKALEQIISHQVDTLRQAAKADTISSPEIKASLSKLLGVHVDGRHMFMTLCWLGEKPAEERQKQSFAIGLPVSAGFQTRPLTTEEGQRLREKYEQQISRVCGNHQPESLQAYQTQARIGALALQLSAAQASSPILEMNTSTPLANAGVYKYHDQLLHRTLAASAAALGLPNNWDLAPEAMGDIPKKIFEDLALSTSFLLSCRNGTGLGRYTLMLALVNMLLHTNKTEFYGMWLKLLQTNGSLLERLFTASSVQADTPLVIAETASVTPGQATLPTAYLGAQNSILGWSMEPIIREILNKSFSTALEDIATRLENDTMTWQEVMRPLQTLCLKSFKNLKLAEKSMKQQLLRVTDKTSAMTMLKTMAAVIEVFEDTLLKQTRFDVYSARHDQETIGGASSEQNFWHITEQNQALQQALFNKRVEDCLHQQRPAWGMCANGTMVRLTSCEQFRKVAAKHKFCGYLTSHHLSEQKAKALTSILDKREKTRVK